MTETARLRLPEIAAAQAQKHVTHNEALTALDTLVQLSVLDKDLTAPPGSPAEGDCYIVASAATGDWTGWDGRVARYEDGAWRSFLPGQGDGLGWLAYVQDEEAFYVLTGSGWVAVSSFSGVFSTAYAGLMSGLVPSSNGGDADHDLDVTSGVAASDDASPALMRLTSSITKRLDATFAEGSGNGGMVSGESLPTSGTVHVWLIMKADGTVDVCASDNAASGVSPTLPSGFAHKRRVFSITTDASANIIGFTAAATAGGGLDVRLKVPATAIDVSNLSTSTVIYSLPVPRGVIFYAQVAYYGFNGSAWRILIQATDDTSTAPASSPPRFSFGGAAGAGAAFAERIRADASGQIKARSTVASTYLQGTLSGWSDARTA